MAYNNSQRNFRTPSLSDKSSCECVVIFVHFYPRSIHSVPGIKDKNSVVRVGCQKLLYCRLSIPEVYRTTYTTNNERITVKLEVSPLRGENSLLQRMVEQTV